MTTLTVTVAMPTWGSNELKPTGLLPHRQPRLIPRMLPVCRGQKSSLRTCRWCVHRRKPEMQCSVLRVRVQALAWGTQVPAGFLQGIWQQLCSAVTKLSTGTSMHPRRRSGRASVSHRLVTWCLHNVRRMPRRCAAGAARGRQRTDGGPCGARVVQLARAGRLPRRDADGAAVLGRAARRARRPRRLLARPSV